MGALHPKYWLAWLAVIAFRCLTLLPLSLQLWLGRCVGLLLRLLIPSRITIVDKNLTACFPTLNQQQRHRLNRQVFASMGQFLMESNATFYTSDKRFNRCITVEMEGYDYFLEAVKTGKGVILLSAHMMVLEVIARFFASKHDFAAVYRQNSSPFYNLLINHGRSKYIHQLIDRNDLKGMIRWLREGKILWYAPDQDFGRDRSEFVDFMGVQTATLKGIADLARLGNAIVVPGFFAREKQPGHYVIQLFPAFENYPTGDYVKDLTPYNQLLGDFVRQYPEQYNWLHRRFKTRPEGEGRFYT